jgi:hypothetical protein
MGHHDHRGLSPTELAFRAYAWVVYLHESSGFLRTSATAISLLATYYHLSDPDLCIHHAQ